MYNTRGDEKNITISSTMNDQVMQTFGRALARSDKETLFKLQVESSVTCSACLLFERCYVQNPIGAKERFYYIGLYRNKYPDSFLILYKDLERKYPKDFIWLKDSLVTSHRHVSEQSLSLHCGGTPKTIVFKFDSVDKRVLWQKSIRDEIVFNQQQQRRGSLRSNSMPQFASSTSSSSSSTRRNSELDQIFSIEKQGCLRQASSRKVSRTRPELQTLFKTPIVNENNNNETQEKTVKFSLKC